ncbi:MAG: circadian clock protein KaiA [Cyanobacteria bacterium J06600_6]
MSDCQDNFTSTNAATNRLQICFFSVQEQLCKAVERLLDGNDYELKTFSVITELGDYVVGNYEQIDCLVLNHSQLESLCQRLKEASILLPTVILAAESINALTETEAELVASLTEENSGDIYHQTEIRLYLTQLKEIRSYISLAINKFIRLAPDAKNDGSQPEQLPKQKSLILQQRRLTEKLKERLGYLGFFYKRNQEHFWTNLAELEQEQVIKQISEGYRQILLLYFDRDSEINRLIDEFVDRAFFADISTSQILEIHMELMDDFAHQLKLEGRNDDILLDYRLPLIDILSHLCEMYRRSIPDSSGLINLPLALE